MSSRSLEKEPWYWGREVLCSVAPAEQHSRSDRAHHSVSACVHWTALPWNEGTAGVASGRAALQCRGVALTILFLNLAPALWNKANMNRPLFFFCCKDLHSSFPSPGPPLWQSDFQIKLKPMNSLLAWHSLNRAKPINLVNNSVKHFSAVRLKIQMAFSPILFWKSSLSECHQCPL